MSRRISIIALMLAVTFLFTAAVPASYAATQSTVTLGDVNADGKINSTDLSLVKRHMLSLTTLSGDALTAADVDANGKINSTDYSYLKRYLLGSITTFPGQTPTSKGPGIMWTDGKLLFPVGVNYAWYNWSYEFSDNNWASNFERIKSDMDTMSSEGIHSLRWWIFPDLCYGPLWSGKTKGSLCTGLPTNWANNMKTVCDYAYSKNIKIYWTITSFDAAKTTLPESHDDIFTDQKVLQNFLDNAMKPILQAVGDSKGVMGWDLLNEPEWIIKSEDHGEPMGNADSFSVAQITNYMNTTIAYIKQYTKQPVSFGSANMKWLGAQYDLWDNVNVDFYDFHWYDWATPYFNPVKTPASSLNLGKPVIIGEMMPDTINSSLKMTNKQVLDAIYANGYSGYMPWSWNDPKFDCKPNIGNDFKDFEAEHPDVAR